jgi:TctA family transporter
MNIYARTVTMSVARISAWAWFFVAGIGGLALLIHQGPLPITNGWFAMFSGIAACPLLALLLKDTAVSLFQRTCSFSLHC